MVKRYEVVGDKYGDPTVKESENGQVVFYEDYAALQKKLDAMAAESDTNLRSAASELNTSWMLHKTMMGAQAALLCLSQGDILSAKEWLEGTTDEVIIEMPDGLNPRDLQEWFDSNMVSNGGSNGFLTHSEALELLRKRAPATDTYLNSVRAEGVEMFANKITKTVSDEGKPDSHHAYAYIAMNFADNLRYGTHDTASNRIKGNCSFCNGHAFVQEFDDNEGWEDVKCQKCDNEGNETDYVTHDTADKAG